MKVSLLRSGRPTFTQPLNTYQFDIHQTTNFKGYTALLGENTDPENRGDMHEGFDIGWEEPEAGSGTRSKDGAMTGGNVWPEVTGFREAALAY